MDDSDLGLPFRSQRRAANPGRMVSRALVSVSDKTGLVPFARALSQRGVEIFSTGGTLKTLKDEGIPVVAVEDYTGSPEVMADRKSTRLNSSH